VAHPTTNTALKVVNPKPGAAVNAAARRKVSKYKELCAVEGLKPLIPLAISAFGRFHPSFSIFLKKISREALNNGAVVDEKQRVAFLRQAVTEVAVILQKGNARIIHRGVIESRAASHRLRRSGRA
jgi:hypothetical protein